MGRPAGFWRGRLVRQWRALPSPFAQTCIEGHSRYSLDQTGTARTLVSSRGFDGVVNTNPATVFSTHSLCRERTWHQHEMTRLPDVCYLCPIVYDFYSHLLHQ